MVGDPFVDAYSLARRAFGARNYHSSRPSGLYDGANPIMLRPILEGLSSRIGSGFTNRIHRDDAASVIAELIKRDLQGQRLPATLNLNDNTPVTTGELEAWCFQELGREPVGQRDNQPRANRRVSNAKLQALGFSLRYPSFREGYKEALSKALTQPGAYCSSKRRSFAKAGVEKSSDQIARMASISTCTPLESGYLHTSPRWVRLIKDLGHHTVDDLEVI